MPDFLPRRDAELVDWSNNFEQHVAADPGAFGLTPDQAGRLSKAHAAFAAAYRRSVTPVSAGPVATLEKNVAREKLMIEARRCAGVVRSDPRVSAAQMVELGLRVRRPKRRRVPAPEQAPGLRVRAAEGHRFELRLIDLQTGRCRKPGDVGGATLMYTVGKHPSSNASDWTWLCNTANPRVTWTRPSDVRPGERVWFTACWFSPTSEPGPLATPVGRVTPLEDAPVVRLSLAMTSPTRLAA